MADRCIRTYWKTKYTKYNGYIDVIRTYWKTKYQWLIDVYVHTGKLSTKYQWLIDVYVHTGKLSTNG